MNAHCRIGKVTAKSARIYTLPGVERRDLGYMVAVEAVLAGALARGLTQVGLVGIDRAGRLYVASSNPDMDKLAGLLMRGVSFISNGEAAPCNGERLGDP